MVPTLTELTFYWQQTINWLSVDKKINYQLYEGNIEATVIRNYGTKRFLFDKAVEERVSEKVTYKLSPVKVQGSSCAGGREL